MTSAAVIVAPEIGRPANCVAATAATPTTIAPCRRPRALRGQDVLAARGDVDLRESPGEHRGDGAREIGAGAEETESTDRPTRRPRPCRARIRRSRARVRGASELLWARAAPDRPPCGEEQDARARRSSAIPSRPPGYPSKRSVRAHQHGVAVDRRVDVAEARVRAARRRRAWRGRRAGPARSRRSARARSRGRARDRRCVWSRPAHGRNGARFASATPGIPLLRRPFVRHERRILSTAAGGFN